MGLDDNYGSVFVNLEHGFGNLANTGKEEKQ
jgi:hypothetical protein